MMVVAFLTVGGCAPSIQVARLETAHRIPTEGDIIIYMRPESVPWPYDEIGILTARTGDCMRDCGNRKVALIRERARRLGADAVIIVSQGTQHGGYVHIPGVLPMSMAVSVDVIRAIAIVQQR